MLDDQQSAHYGELARRLNEIEPGSEYGGDFHNALCRLIPPTAIEAVALRERPGQSGKLEVLLRQRGPNEPAYPGWWHCPGSFLRPGESLGDVFRRMGKGEALGRVLSWRLVDNLIWTGERGGMPVTVNSAIYLVTVSGAPEELWFPVGEWPDPLIPKFRDEIIPKVVALYRDSV